MTPRSLVEEFRTRLGVIQPPAQVSLFESDLLRANLDIMAAALKEARALSARSGSPPRHARDTVLAIYSAKLAEVAQLFPLFFIFESAFRSFTAARLTVIYGDDGWWEPVREAVLRARPTTSIHRLGNRQATRDVKDTVQHLIRGMGQGARSITTTYDLLEGGTLAHVERLIDHHWSDMSQVFHRPPGSTSMTASSFRNLFKVVRMARNDAYHHRTVAGRPRMVEISEQLLDLLDISLGSRIGQVSAATIPALRFAIPPEPRHS